jgi:hypothetical protein
MKIKPTTKRIEFERILRTLGYRDRLPVFIDNNKKYQQVNFKCPSGDMAIYTFIILYETKKSYLYLEFLDNYENNNLNEKLKILAERINFKEKTRIAEVGWEVKYSKNPSEFSLSERKQVLYHFIKYTYENLKNGMVEIKPNPGDILVAKPYGPKIDLGFTESSLEIGTRQRSIIASKFGFGNLKEDGFQYAKYDENLIVTPI